MKKSGVIVLVLLSALFLGYFLHQEHLGRAGISPMSAFDINIARNINNGRGTTLSASWFSYPPKPLVRPSVGERGHIYPFLLSCLLKRNLSPALFNMLFCLLTAVVFFMLIDSVYGAVTAWLSFFWLMLNPFFNYWGVFLWESPIIAFFLTLSLYILVNRRQRAWVMGAGALLGFTFWTDLWFIFSIFAFLPGILLWEKDRKTALDKCLFFSLGFLLICVPELFLIYQVQGSPIPVHLPVYFQVKDYSLSIWEHYNSPPPQVLSFVGGNFIWIMGKILQNITSYAKRAFFDYGTWIIISGLLLRLFFKDQDKPSLLPQNSIPLTVFSLVYFTGISLVWSNFSHQKDPLFSALFIIPPVFYMLTRIKWKDYPAGFLTCALLLMVTVNFYYDGVKNEMKDQLNHKNFKSASVPDNEAERWLYIHTGANVRTASIKPWDIYLITGQDSGILPINLKPEQYAEFAEKLGYNYIINNDKTEIGAKFRKNINYEEIPGMTEVYENVWKREPTGGKL